MTLQSDALRRTALILVSVGLAWNVVEGALCGRGGVLLWQLMSERAGAEGEAAERRARRLVGLTFFLLAAYVGVHSVASLLGWLPEPEPSLIGIAIAVASAVVMSVLYALKMRIAARIQSRALRAEAVESLFCDLQDLAILVGLGFNALFAWWWADPVAALILIPLFIKEGRENLSEEEEEDEDGGSRVCFGPECAFGMIVCRAACCQV